MEKRRTLLAPAVPVVDQQVVPEALGQAAEVRAAEVRAAEVRAAEVRAVPAAVLVVNSLKRSTVTPASLFARYRSNFRQWRAW